MKSFIILGSQNCVMICDVIMLCDVRSVDMQSVIVLNVAALTGQVLTLKRKKFKLTLLETDKAILPQGSFILAMFVRETVGDSTMRLSLLYLTWVT